MEWAAPENAVSGTAQLSTSRGWGLVKLQSQQAARLKVPKFQDRGANRVSRLRLIRGQGRRLTALVSVAAIGALTAMGNSLGTMFNTVSSALSGAVGG